jgi:DNA-binding CsgD family transcriptional regulator
VHTDQIVRARHRITDLATTARNADEYRGGVLGAVGDLVPWDGAVLVEFDPASLLITAGTMQELDAGQCATAVEIELAERDCDLYADLARDAPGVAVLSRSVAGDMARSARFRELYRPFGLYDELRAVNRSGGSCWGGMSLAREPGHDFTADDAAVLAALEDVIADGLRLMHLRTIATAADAQPSAGPAVIVLDANGAVDSGTTEAMELLARLSGERVEPPALLLPVHSVASRIRTSPGSVARVRLHAADGSWLVLHAAPLRSADRAARTVVTIEPARPPEVVSIIAALIGLSHRETEVLEHLLAGRTSVEIARRLFLSPYTINDHIRHIFDKAGVHNRKELMTWLFFSHYAQQSGHRAV